MLLCNLPEVITAIMLEKCVGASDGPVHHFKRNLPLLAVCQQWRRVAIPLVYTDVYVWYDDQPERGTSPVDRNHTREEPINAVVKTNLDLIAVAGCARAARRVHIDLHYLINPLPGWRDVTQRMRTVASKWRVVELTVNMKPSACYYDGSAVDVANYTDDIGEVSDLLATLMPDVRIMKCEGDNCNQLARSLYGRLVSHYADQLQCIESRPLMSMPPGRQLKKLKRFHMSYEGVADDDTDDVADYQLPHVVSGGLVEMSLVCGPSNHSWASFNTDSDSWVIEFTKLKDLCMVYYADYQENGITARHRDGHPWELHFPSLMSLSIRCSEGTCPLLEYAVLPPHMESISIDLNSAVYRDHANVQLPETKLVSLSVNEYSYGDASGLPAVNRILESARGSEVLELKIDDRILFVGPESITCTALTHLEITAPTTVDTMLAIIRTLPHLVKLTFKDLDLSDIQVDISIPDADKDAVVEPLHTSLKSLNIGSSWDSRVWNAARAVEVLEYMLLRIPTLTRVHSREIPKEPVRNFVWSYTPRYPHLSGVVLSLHGA